MITAALATTSISVFTTYAVPLIVVGASVALVTWFASFVLSKWVLPKDDCFETSVGAIRPVLRRTCHRTSSVKGGGS